MSMAVRVDDRRPGRADVPNPVIVATVDRFGDSIANQRRIANTSPSPRVRASTNVMRFAPDHVVNMEDAGMFEGPILRSNLRGRAQLQLFPPSIELAGAPGSVTVHLRMIARYFPDPNTRRVAEFVRGDLSITAPVNQIASQVGNVVEIDIRGATVQVNFVPQWSSRPLSVEDVAAHHHLDRRVWTGQGDPLRQSCRQPRRVALRTNDRGLGRGRHNG